MVARECPRLKHLELWFFNGLSLLTADAVRAIEKGFPQLQSLRFAADARTSAAATELCDSRPNLTSGVSHFASGHLNAPINIKLVSQDGNEVFFKCMVATLLGKLMRAYCTRQGLRRSSVHFRFDETRIKEKSRPFELGMENGDIIDCMVEP